jgi:hypothetical protein
MGQPRRPSSKSSSIGWVPSRASLGYQVSRSHGGASPHGALGPQECAVYLADQKLPILVPLFRRNIMAVSRRSAGGCPEVS